MKSISLPAPDEKGVYRYAFGAKIWPVWVGPRKLWKASWSNGVMLADEDDEPSYFRTPAEAHDCISRHDPALEDKKPLGPTPEAFRARALALFARFKADLRTAMGHHQEASVDIALDNLEDELKELEPWPENVEEEDET